MMDDSPNFPPEETPDRLILIAIEERYWLFEGEEFLGAMLRGSGFFPKPVQCLRFKDSFEMRIFLGPERPMNKFWLINPDIIERLRRNDHLLEIEGPEG